MAQFVVAEGQRLAWQGRAYLGGDHIELDLVDAEGLLESGVLQHSSGPAPVADETTTDDTDTPQENS